MTENVTLSPRQESAIAAILAHGVLTRAAEATGVSLRQLHRWLEIPAFQAELRKQQDELRSGTVRRLQVCMLGAVDVLANVMVDASQAAGVRISAAGKLLDAALKAAEIHDLAQRVAELEALAPAQVANDYRRVVDYRLTLPALAHDTGDAQTPG